MYEVHLLWLLEGMNRQDTGKNFVTVHLRAVENIPFRIVHKE